jgi:hypothetical protein
MAIRQYYVIEHHNKPFFILFVLGFFGHVLIVPKESDIDAVF